MYNSFVATSVLRDLSENNGRFFNSVSPDVYSGLAILARVPRYLYSTRPFSVGGCSASSNGVLFLQSRESSIRSFFGSDGFDIPQHPRMRVIPGSLYSGLVEAFLQANDHCHGGQLNIDLKRGVARILDELHRKDEETREAGIRELLEICPDLEGHIRSCVQRSQPASPNGSGSPGPDDDEYLVLDAAPLGIETIHDCARFVANVVGSCRLPEKVPFGWKGLASTWVLRRAKAHLAGRSL